MPFHFPRCILWIMLGLWITLSNLLYIQKDFVNFFPIPTFAVSSYTLLILSFGSLLTPLFFIVLHGIVLVTLSITAFELESFQTHFSSSWERRNFAWSRKLMTNPILQVIPSWSWWIHSLPSRVSSIFTSFKPFINSTIFSSKIWFLITKLWQGY